MLQQGRRVMFKRLMVHRLKVKQQQFARLHVIGAASKRFAVMLRTLLDDGLTGQRWIRESYCSLATSAWSGSLTLWWNSKLCQKPCTCVCVGSKCKHTLVRKKQRILQLYNLVYFFVAHSYIMAVLIIAVKSNLKDQEVSKRWQVFLLNCFTHQGPSEIDPFVCKDMKK